MVNADIKPVVWVKRRQTKPGQLFRRGVKPSAVRTVAVDQDMKRRMLGILVAQNERNEAMKRLAAARKATK
jgi:hypothetical protein